MKNPTALVSRHPRLHEHSSAAWGLELVLQLHGRRCAARHPFQRRRPFPEDDFAPRFLAAVRTQGIETEVIAYGADFGRFETDLAKKRRDGICSFPLVQVPVIAHVNGTTAGLHVRACTFLVGEERGEPVFLTRQARSTAVAEFSLKQLRTLHEAWRSWPIVLPSMLLTALWHRSEQTE